MAEGRNIEIKIAATGGDQAAAEVAKPAAAVAKTAEEIAKATAEAEAASTELYRKMREADEAYRKSIVDGWNKTGTNPYAAAAGGGKLPEMPVAPGGTGFGGMLDQVPQKAQAAAESVREVTKETEKLVETVEEVDKKSDKLDENVEKITRLQKAQVIAQLGGQVSQLGAAFNTVADGIESFDKDGAKSLRSIGDNLETAGSAVTSLAIGFAVGGPLGAGVAALGEGVKYVATEMGKAAEEAVKMEAKYDTAFDRLIDKMGTVAGEKAKLELKTWLATLDDEEAAIQRQNDALARNQELIEAKAAAQAKLDAAKTRNEIAAIDADPTLSDAEKIRRKATVTEAAEKKKVEDAVNAQGRDVSTAEQDAQGKDAEAKRLAADAEAVRARKDAEDAERKQLERRAKIKAAAEAAIPAAAAQAAADQKNAEIQRRNPFGAEGRQKKADASQQQLEDLKNKAYANPEEAVRLDELNANKAKLEAEATKAAEAARAARESAEKAKLDAAAKRRTLEETLPTTVETYQFERQGRATSSGAAAAAAEARAKEKADRKADQDRDKAAAAADKDARDAGRVGRDAERLLPKGVSDQFRGAIEKASAKLQDGGTAAELAELAQLLSELGASTNSAVNGVQSEIAAAKAEIAQLRKKIKIQ